MKLVIISTFIFAIFILSGCQSVQTTINQKTKEENDRLEVFINKSVEETFIEFGQPFSDKKNEKGIREVTFKEKRIFGVKCLRTFIVDNSNIVSGFKSTGCY
tara:strand:- start:47 stop:352 length:306 start_codon:yes stop_codon:yes gene_type:complete